MALTAALALAGLSQAAAQFPPPPGQAASSASNPFPPPPGQQQSNPFPPPPGQQTSPFPPAPGSAPSQSPGRAGAFPPPPGARSVCDQFPPIRAQAEKDAGAIKTASDRKAAREEVCALFNKFVSSESKMAKFLETNQTACGVPADAIKQVKAQHAKTLQIRKNVCSAGPSPRGPSLSDALGGPILPDTTPKPGRGTFDTLTGSPLAR
jgi:hypothetical protein